MIQLDSYKDFVVDLYSSMTEQQLSLVYEGEVNQSITRAFAEMAKSNMEVEESEPVKNRVFHVMIECLQNIAKHSYDRESDDDIYNGGSGLFIVGKTDGQYFITTGNRIANVKADVLKEVLEELNTLDQDGIKKLYKKKILENRISDNGGAGLGLIDIVKKTKNQIEYHISPMAEDTSFVILMSKVNRA